VRNVAEEDCTGLAFGAVAPQLCSRESQLVSQGPRQHLLFHDVHSAALSVNVQADEPLPGAASPVDGGAAEQIARGADSRALPPMTPFMNLRREAAFVVSPSIFRSEWGISRILQVSGQLACSVRVGNKPCTRSARFQRLRPPLRKAAKLPRFADFCGLHQSTATAKFPPAVFCLQRWMRSRKPRKSDVTASADVE
jgi:hypothetical protein